MANYEELVHLDIINAMEIEEANLKNKRRVFNRQDAFDMPEHQFVKLFRLTKNVKLHSTTKQKVSFRSVSEGKHNRLSLFNKKLQIVWK